MKYVFVYKNTPNEILGLCSSSSLEEAIKYFSLVKQLEVKEFLKIFDVKVYEREK